MRKSSSETDTTDRSNITQIHPTQSTQHGYSLLSLPSESLTHITSFLDPASLLILSRTCQLLYSHVKDDNTWRRAFVCQVLGVSPDRGLQDIRSLTLRLSEPSWKIEFILRDNTRRRWMRSRNSTITHTPHEASISHIHVLSDDALLSSSVQYGIVARSFPFTGKIIKGFIDSSGMRHGMGVGNPNAEFAPDVTACVLASEGSSAHIIWGRRDGSLSVMFHARTMSGSRVPAKVYNSTFEDQHTGAVMDAAWAADGGVCITVGADGRVKIWNMKRFSCVWTSDRRAGPHAESHIKVVQDIVNGYVAVATEHGDVVMYSGFDAAQLHAGVTPTAVQVVRIPAPALMTDEQGMDFNIRSIFLEGRSSALASVLVNYQSNPYFFRYTINFTSSDVQVSAFGDPASGPTRSIMPAFSQNPNEPNFIVVGDTLGSISLYDWDAVHSDTPIPPVRRIDIFADAYVSAVAVSKFVIVAGSSRGALRVLDAITFDPLRSFAAPMNDAVRQIILRRDVLFASVGKRVLAWKAGPVNGNSKDPYKGKGKGKVEGHQKWQKQYELKRDIAESRDDIKNEFHHVRESFGREREQLSQLDALGLSEREAVEYVLMLSRDENRKREVRPRQEEEGVFDADFDDDAPEGSRRPTSIPTSPSSRSPPPRPSSSPSTSLVGSYSHLSISPSTSNIKVQVSPRFYPEPTEAGGLSSSPLDLNPLAPIHARTSAISFPSMNTPPRSMGKSPSSVSSGSGSSSKHSAWNTPLRSKPSPPPSPPNTHSKTPPGNRSPRTGQSSGGAPSRRMSTGANNDWDREPGKISGVEDADLRFALELSLAEARSREDIS